MTFTAAVSIVSEAASPAADWSEPVAVEFPLFDDVAITAGGVIHVGQSVMSGLHRGNSQWAPGVTTSTSELQDERPTHSQNVGPRAADCQSPVKLAGRRSRNAATPSR